MASRIYLAPHLSSDDLERRYKAAMHGIERSHLQIIWLLSQGHSAQMVASVTGYSPTWISKIVWRYNDHGVEGLGDRRHDNPGAAALLDAAQQERLRAVLAEPPPDQGRWTGRKVAQWMAGQLGRLVSPQRGVEYMRRLGFTPQVPRPCHVGADWIEEHRFKLQARVVELTRTETALPLEVWSLDEHRVGLKPIIRRVWAPRGQRPAAPGHHRYQWLYLYGFVRPASGEIVWFVSNAIDAAMFGALLEAFAREIGAGPDKHVILVLDGAGSHVAKDLQVPDGIELMFLPAYSPELQPAEHLWPLTDEALANTHFETLNDLDEALAERCRILADDPDQIRANTLFHWWPKHN